MLTQRLSDKQLDSYFNSNKRLNFWEGSVRSGKSFSSILRFISEIKDGPKGSAMIVGTSRDSIQRNVIAEMCNLLGFPMPTPKTTQMELFGRTIYLVGANDERAQKRIQGSTLAMAYVDELSLIPYGFFKMLLSRLSVKDAKLFATTNPDSPFHWVKTEYLDNPDLDLSRFTFRLDDNPSLDEFYIKHLKKEYSGLWYDRYIDGKWVLAEGCVYGFFDHTIHVIDYPPRATQYILGVDYGTTNPTAFVMIGINKESFPNYWTFKEYYWDSKKEMRQKTDSEYADDLADFISGFPVTAIYIDPSAASFRLECGRRGIQNIFEANNDVLDGIRFVSQLLSDGTFKISSNCKHLIEEMGSYVWDTKATERGEDKPLKEHDHICDATRYSLFTHLGKRISSDITAKELEVMKMKAWGYQPNLPSVFQEPVGGHARW